MSHTEVREYLWEGRAGPFGLLLGERVFAPTHTSRELAEGLVVEAGETVIDVGCGSGVLSFVAARLGAARVYGVDISAEAVASARRNAEVLGLADRVTFRVGDLFEPVGEVRGDVVIGDVSGIPDDIARLSGWFPGGFAGGPTGAEVPVAMLEQAPRYLVPGGRLYLPTGSIQDEGTVLRAARRIFGESRISKIGERLLPLPTKIGESAIVRRLAESGVVDFIRRGSRILWALRIWECRAPGGPADD